MITLLTGVVDVGAVLLAGGAGFVVGRHRRSAPRPRLCSCEHGFGGHTRDGCQMTVEVELGLGDGVIRDAAGDPVRDADGYVQRGPVSRTFQLMPCGCQRFDGEIPPDMIGREYLGLGDT